MVCILVFISSVINWVIIGRASILIWTLNVLPKFGNCGITVVTRFTLCMVTCWASWSRPHYCVYDNCVKVAILWFCFVPLGSCTVGLVIKFCTATTEKIFYCATPSGRIDILLLSFRCKCSASSESLQSLAAILHNHQCHKNFASGQLYVGICYCSSFVSLAECL